MPTAAAAAPYPLPPAQVLLRNLGAHKLALRLLSLPVADKPVASELQTRAVLRAAYRLLKAMASGFAQLQAELVPAIPTFVAHVEKRLVAYDISPTGTISATLKDNRAACALVSVETIRHFVRLASREHAPRFLRFLTLLCVPGGEPVRRNQTLILQALADHEAALLLFAGHSGRAARALLIQADDHVHHPRGRLAYHIELIGLLAALTIGENAAAEGLMRELVPLPELVDQVAGMWKGGGRGHRSERSGGGCGQVERRARGYEREWSLLQRAWRFHPSRLIRSCRQLVAERARLLPTPQPPLLKEAPRGRAHRLVRLIPPPRSSGPGRDTGAG